LPEASCCDAHARSCKERHSADESDRAYRKKPYGPWHGSSIGTARRTLSDRKGYCFVVSCRRTNGVAPPHALRRISRRGHASE
jgi:hypothetical protein